MFLICFFVFHDTATTETYTLSLHDALPICAQGDGVAGREDALAAVGPGDGDLPLPGEPRSEEHTSELQSRGHLVCRLLLEKKKKKVTTNSEDVNLNNLDRTRDGNDLCVCLQ